MHGLDLLVQLPAESWIRRAPTDGRYAAYVDFHHITFGSGRVHTAVSGGGRWQVVQE